MIWNRQNNLTIVELGAINGFVFGSLLELSLRAIYLFHAASYPLSWWVLPIFSFVLVTLASYLASYLASRCLSQSIKSSFWLWQVIGFVAVLGACLYSVLMVLYSWYFIGFDFSVGVEYLADVIPSELWIVLRVLPVVIFFNFLFAAVLRVWKKRLL